MSDNQHRSRHAAGTQRAGAPTGGQFKQEQKSTSDGAALSAPSAPKRMLVTVPAHVASLTINEPLNLPDGIDTVGDVQFGIDDSGRFHTSCTFGTDDGESFDVICTDFEDGPDWDADTTPEGVEVRTPEFDAYVYEMHDRLRDNAQATGLDSPDQSHLGAQAVAAALGTPIPEDPAFDMNRHPKDRATDRVSRIFKAYSGSEMHQIDNVSMQDVISDLVWIAKDRGYDVDDIINQAREMQDDEERDPAAFGNIRAAFTEEQLEEERAVLDRETKHHYVPGELSEAELTPGHPEYEERFDAWLRNEYENRPR